MHTNNIPLNLNQQFQYERTSHGKGLLNQQEHVTQINIYMVITHHHLKCEGRQTFGFLPQNYFKNIHFRQWAQRHPRGLFPHQLFLYFIRPWYKKWHHKTSNLNEIILKSFTDLFMDSFRHPNETSNQCFLWHHNAQIGLCHQIKWWRHGRRPSPNLRVKR